MREPAEDRGRAKKEGLAGHGGCPELSCPLQCNTGHMESQIFPVATFEIKKKGTGEIHLT